VSDPHPRRRDGAKLQTDLVKRASTVRDAAMGPTVESIVTIADPSEAAELRAQQLSIIVRLLRQAVELCRAA
jgi:hypothetical protein